MKRFIDDVAVEVIEVCLVSGLASLLSPVGVYKMAPDLVALIAGESEENQARREQLVRQLEVLDKGAETCQDFVGVNLSGKLCKFLVRDCANYPQQTTNQLRVT